MVIKLSDIFKGNINIINTTEIYNEHDIIVIREIKGRLHSGHKPIKLGVLLRDGYKINHIITFIANHVTESEIVYANNKLIVVYKCSRCGMYLMLDDNYGILCPECLKRGAVKW